MKISCYHYSHILLRRDVENVHVLTPDVLYKTICFLDQHIVCGVMVWSANIGAFMMTCSHPLRVFILNNVVMLFNHVYITSRHPIHHSQGHMHFKCLGVEVDPLGQVGEKLVVKRLHPVGVSALEEQIYIHEHDMYCPCCIQDGMNQPLCR